MCYIGIINPNQTDRVYYCSVLLVMYHISQHLSDFLSAPDCVQVDLYAEFCTVSAGPGVAVWVWACGRRVQVISVVKNFNFKWNESFLKNYFFLSGLEKICLVYCLSQISDEQRADTPRGTVWLVRSGLMYVVCTLSGSCSIYTTVLEVLNSYSVS